MIPSDTKASTRGAAAEHCNKTWPRRGANERGSNKTTKSPTILLSLPGGLAGKALPMSPQQSIEC